MDQALEKAYNKSANGQAEFIGISRRKQVVWKWSISKHEKAKYENFLHVWWCLNNHDEFVALHESYQSITKQGEKCVRAITDYITWRGNPFATLSSQPITNIVTNAQLDELNTFLLHCLKLGETAYGHFGILRNVDYKKKLRNSLIPSQK